MNPPGVENSDDFFNDGESETRFVDTYIGKWSEEDRDLAEFVADQITTEKELPATVVIIPVAAHLETRNVLRALTEYAKQETTEEFAVHLHLNWPDNFSDFAPIQQTFDEVSKAQTLFPHLDIRVSQMYYQEGKIGAIRRAAWNGTLLKLYQQGNYQQAVGINNDIDVLRLSKTYVGNVQKFYADLHEQEMRPFVIPTASTQIKHEFDPEYPNSSMTIFWQDFSSRMRKGSYEAGVVIPMTTYALDEGFSNDDATHETSRFYSPLGPAPMIPGTSLTTSARRYLDRLPEHDYGTIWTNDSFGTDDKLRVRTDFVDISRDEMVRKVSDDATYFAVNYIDSLLTWQLTFDEEAALVSEKDDVRVAMEEQLFGRMRKTERMTRYVLDVALEVPKVGEFLSTHYFNEAYFEHMLYIKRLDLQRRKAKAPELFTDPWIQKEADDYEASF